MAPRRVRRRGRALLRVVVRAAMLAVVGAVAACARDVGDRADTAATAPGDATSRDTASADTVVGAADTATVARPPETDPWMFEGIPTFDDLVALRDGDWLVVLASAPHGGAPPRPTVVRAADPRIAAVQQRAWTARLVPFAVPSERLPAFEPGLTVLVLGPHARGDAERRLADARRVAPDAYLKAGW